MLVFLHDLTEEQRTAVSNVAVFGADFDEETDDASCADIEFFWIDVTRCDVEPPFLAATMLWIGQAVGRGHVVWACADTDLSKHPALWTIDLVSEVLPPFENPAAALVFLVNRHMHTMPYREYLKTTHWDMTRYFAIRAAGERCQLCNTTKKPLHVHHRTYERRGHEQPDDLIVLCAHCHAKFHNKLPKGGDE